VSEDAQGPVSRLLAREVPCTPKTPAGRSVSYSVDGDILRWEYKPVWPSVVSRDQEKFGAKQGMRLPRSEKATARRPRKQFRNLARLLSPWPDYIFFSSEKVVIWGLE